MTEEYPVCPDSGPDDERHCWSERPNPGPVDGTTDIVAFLKAEMLDGMDHEYMHGVLGPAIFGDTDGVPNFVVRRNANNGSWEVAAKPEWEPKNLRGLL